MNSHELLIAFDRYLTKRKLTLEAVVIGGTALNLLGVVNRPTKDCDILHPDLPPEIDQAARTFAAEIRNGGEVLRDDWLNNGPASLKDHLPSGWQQRLRIVFIGKSLLLNCLGRDDLLRTKLFALCDRSTDIGDCIALAPTTDELDAAQNWLEVQDGNPEWPEHVQETLNGLRRKLGHGI